ncbi:MAG: hypothetical protein NTZ95_06035 [Candidatus Omnitrophica bacterium]|nr:hypothetical protein [Candidatus Omnitrophota bacterium]
MTEEKKEEIKEVKAAEAAQKAPEGQTVASPLPAAAQPAEPKIEVKAEVAKEKPSNCGGCKKSIKKKRWYYRDGKYYCSKRCFKSTLKKEEKAEEPKA